MATTEIYTYCNTLSLRDGLPICLPRDESELAGALVAAGFVAPDAALRTVAEWRSGKLRALRSPAALEALETVMPELMKALGKAPDPDAALNRFHKLVAGLTSAVPFFPLLRSAERRVGKEVGSTGRIRGGAGK